MNNEQLRTYNFDGCYYLNLFSGYKYDKQSTPDENRINKGNNGVQFIWNHMKDQFCSNDEVYFTNLQNAIRKMVAGHKLQILIYLKTKMGKGKGKITNFLKAVIGNQVCMTLKYVMTLMDLKVCTML